MQVQVRIVANEGTLWDAKWARKMGHGGIQGQDTAVGASWSLGGQSMGLVGQGMRPSDTQQAAF